MNKFGVATVITSHTHFMRQAEYSMKWTWAHVLPTFS